MATCRSEMWVDFGEELHARGWAEVIEEAPCPEIEAGNGRVITATITHANDDVRTLTMSGGETLYVTGNHRMFSATRGEWVAVKDLAIGEELKTSCGRKSVAALGYQRGRHQVYNLEVEAEHCYFVGKAGALGHNTCGGSPTESSRWKEELPEGEMRTPEENKKARNYFKNNKELAKEMFTERTGKEWPSNATHASHPRPLKNGGHPLHVEPGYGGSNSEHMVPGPDGKTDHQRWGSLGGKASAAKRQTQAASPPARRRR